MTSTMKTQRNIVVRGLFATLLAAFEGPNGQERDSDPVGRVLRKRNKTPAGQASNAVGWRSDREMLDLRVLVQACTVRRSSSWAKMGDPSAPRKRSGDAPD